MSDEARVAVITGGNRGIGRAIALAMAREGVAVVISARSTDALAKTARDVEREGAECLPVGCDVRDEDSVRRMGDAVLDRFGRADVVVANAGVAGPTRPLHEITLAEWRDCVATDLDGAFLTFRRFIPGMIERRTGSLVAISSMTGKRPLHGRTPYTSAKMGLIGMVRTLAVELGPYGIRANTVCPGAVTGPRIDDVVRRQAESQGISEDEVRRQFSEASPLKRLVDAEDVAAACVFLASERGAAITGEDLNVSAGVVMY
ncbi:MAG: SDR family NAD(P)-dependent oxidoreductase [Streptomycetales bacterium]